MRHRHWFLVASLAPLAFSFVFIRLPQTQMSYPNFGTYDMSASVTLFVTCVAAWTVLEVVSRVLDARRLVCRCGYSLRGVKCPECGKEIG